MQNVRHGISLRINISLMICANFISVVLLLITPLIPCWTNYRILLLLHGFHVRYRSNYMIYLFLSFKASLKRWQKNKDVKQSVMKMAYFGKYSSFWDHGLSLGAIKTHSGIRIVCQGILHLYYTAMGWGSHKFFKLTWQNKSGFKV